MKDSYIEALIERFVNNANGFAQWKTDYLWMRLKTGRFEDQLSLTVEYQQREDKKVEWEGTANTTAGFFPNLDEVKRWLQTEDGFDRINHCLQQLEVISNKEPYEDWDW